MSKPPSRSYIGIDPSLTSTGATFIVGSVCIPRVIAPAKSLRGVPRLLEIRERLREILNEAALFSPIGGAAVEGPSLYSVNRADDLGQLRGIVLLLLSDHQIPTVVVPPTSLKKFATGSGGATKEDMITAAAATWGTCQFQEDSADAAWLARIAQACDKEGEPLTRPQMEVVAGIRTPKKKRPRISTRTAGNI